MRALAVVIVVITAGCHKHYNVSQPEMDQGITSPTHAQHLGGMVFSNQDIPEGKETSVPLVDRWDVSKPIYVRFYAKYPSWGQVLKKHGVESENFDDDDSAPEWSERYGLFDAHVKMVVPGNHTEMNAPRTKPQLHTGQSTGATSWRLEYDYDHKVSHDAYAPLLDLPPGEHPIEIRVYAEADDKPIATGKVIAVIPKGWREKFIAEHDRDDARANESSSSSVSSGGGDESAAPDRVSATVHSDCATEASYIIKGPSGNFVASGGMSTGTTLDAELPATVCVPKPGSYDCAGNSVALSAGTSVVNVASNCRTLSSQ